MRIRYCTVQVAAKRWVVSTPLDCDEESNAHPSGFFPCYPCNFLAAGMQKKKKKYSVTVISFLLFSQTQMPDPKTYKQHFENKHPKNPLPAELKDVPSL